MTPRYSRHIPALDGWRGISISLVLLVHLFPLKQVYRLDYMAATSGMAIFFCLSGYLVTSQLLNGDSIGQFAIKRTFRIAPLAWLYISIIAIFNTPNLHELAANYLFIANIPPQKLMPAGEHFWSLCQEMQFYFGIALLFWGAKKYAHYLVPAAAILFMLIKDLQSGWGTSFTHNRIDEILFGSTLALALNSQKKPILRIFESIPQLIATPLFLLTCAIQTQHFNTLRGPMAALLIGTTICQPNTKLSISLGSKRLKYLASISFALYVIHPALTHTWLGQGSIVEKYAKRPLLLAALFFLAHLSTHRFESFWNAKAKSICRNLSVNSYTSAGRP